MHPDDLPRTAAQFTQLLNEPGASSSDIFRYRHKDGSWRWLEGTGTNLLQEPNVKAIVGNFHDITEQRKTIEALHQSVADYKRVQDELGEAGRRKDEFAWPRWHMNSATPWHLSQTPFISCGWPGMMPKPRPKCWK